MKQESLFFLALIPNDEVCQEITSFKQLAFQKFGTQAALRSPAHITLHMPFKWKEKKEDLLIEKLSEFEFSNFPFSIELQDFGFFSPRVVYVNVLENDLLQSLQKNLVAYVRQELHIFNADYKNKPFHPHLTVAFRDLKKSIFPEAQEFFSANKYEANFQAERLCLLKHDGKRWNEFYYF